MVSVFGVLCLPLRYTRCIHTVTAEIVASFAYQLLLMMLYGTAQNWNSNALGSNLVDCIAIQLNTDSKRIYSV